MTRKQFWLLLQIARPTYKLNYIAVSNSCVNSAVLSFLQPDSSILLSGLYCYTDPAGLRIICSGINWQLDTFQWELFEATSSRKFAESGANIYCQLLVLSKENWTFSKFEGLVDKHKYWLTLED